jgi:hypothetical protein
MLDEAREDHKESDQVYLRRKCELCSFPSLLLCVLTVIRILRNISTCIAYIKEFWDSESMDGWLGLLSWLQCKTNVLYSKYANPTHLIVDDLFTSNSLATSPPLAEKQIVDIQTRHSFT